MNTGFLGPAVATALTVYGIETQYHVLYRTNVIHQVATALTVYGIETFSYPFNINITITLQQHLPFTVLKLRENRLGVL